MSIAPHWAEFIPSSAAEADRDAPSDDAPSTYSTVWTHVSVPAETSDDTAEDLDSEAADGLSTAIDGDDWSSDVGGYDTDIDDEVRGDVDELAHGRVSEYTAMPGIPGRGVCMLSLVAVGVCAGLDLALTSAITMFFDLCFVTVCLVASMAVRRRDLFTTGVLPPLLFAAVMGIVAVSSPETFVQVGGAFKAFMTGLAVHAPALVAGYAVALISVGSRVSASRAR
jgi:hypothetical protein